MVTIECIMVDTIKSRCGKGGGGKGALIYDQTEVNVIKMVIIWLLRRVQ
jgi:hypothetical protein